MKVAQVYVGCECFAIFCSMFRHNSASMIYMNIPIKGATRKGAKGAEASPLATSKSF